MEPETTHITLDVNGQYPLRLNAAGTALQLDLSNSTSKHLLSHLSQQVELDAGYSRVSPDVDGKVLSFPLPEPLKLPTALKLIMNNQPIASLEVNSRRQLSEAFDHHLCQFDVVETRALSRALSKRLGTIANFPYDRAKRQGFDPSVHAPITDVHTHSSAQIKAKDLIDVALEVSKTEVITYPLELLNMLGIELDESQKDSVVSVNSFEFSPTKRDGLACEQGGKTKCEAIPINKLTKEQLNVIIRQMQVAADATISFSQFDSAMYRFRNPLVKHPALAKPILLQIAKDYHDQGIQYAELSTGSMLNPDWFKGMVEAVEEAQQKYGVTMRFLVGVPRSLTNQDTLAVLEKAKYAARHPYIVGIDLLGYESTKTEDIRWALAHIAQWAQAKEGGSDLKQADWNFQRDFIVRVHAGETSKNINNVAEAISLADEYDVRLRVAHALNAKMDAQLASQISRLGAKQDTSLPIEDQRDANGKIQNDRIAFEMCPPSNQVFNNINFAHQVPIERWKNVSPIFLGTDGGGAVLTGPKQLAYTALATGMTLDELAHMRQFEEGYISRQGKREELKTKAFNERYAQGLDEFLQEFRARKSEIETWSDRTETIQPAVTRSIDAQLPPQFQDKTPLLVAGASGGSWERMDEHAKRQTEQSMELLVNSCDPRTTYFVLGRVQNEGVSKALDRAIKRYNQENPTNKFHVLALYAPQTSYGPSGDMAESITWMREIGGGSVNVPDAMLDFVTEHGGRALYFGGSSYTRDLIHGSEQHGIPFGIVTNAQGATQDMAELIDDQHHVESFQDLAQKLNLLLGPMDGHRSQLRPDIDLSDDGVRVLQEEAIMGTLQQGRTWATGATRHRHNVQQQSSK